MTYRVFLDDMLFPVAPSKMQTKVSNKNKTISTISDNEISMIKGAGLSEITFEVLIPYRQLPFAMYDTGFKPIEYFLSRLESMKNALKPIFLKVIRQESYGTEIQVTLEDYTISEDAKDGKSVTVAIKLKNYAFRSTKEVSVTKPTLSGGGKTVAVKTTRQVTKVVEKNYVVKAGDTLWAIAKKNYGDGSKYKDIALLNNISNPNKLSVGQVIRLG